MVYVCVVAEAMDAYQAFCQIVPRHMEGSNPHSPLSVPQSIVDSDQHRFVSWLQTYKESRPNKWWKLEPAAQIVARLYHLPIRGEVFQEVSELVRCIQKSEAGPVLIAEF